MKSLKFFIHEMGIDINDVQILIKACCQYLMKTCYQWAKDHPLVSSVMLFFYLLYIFFPSLFSILFYSFPLVICLAILLRGPRFSLEKHRNDTKIDSVANTSIDHRNNLSRRTFAVLDKNLNHKKLADITQEKTQIFTRITSSRSDSDSQSEEDEEQDQEKNKRVVEWTDYDQRNLMDLGSSEIERNKRLESLIAKRMARKMFSMQPRRNKFYSFDHHDQIDHQVMGSILVSREGIVDGDLQPGSAPTVLLPTRNPFDLPYDPHEEKPVLTGGSFDEEFIHDELQHRDLFKDPFSMCHDNHENFKDDPFHPRFLTKPRVVSDKSTTMPFMRKSEESLKEIAEELSMREEKNQTIFHHEESPQCPHQEVLPNQIQNENHDEASTSQPKEEEENPQSFENPFAIDNEIKGSDHFISLPENIIHMESMPIFPSRDVAWHTQDHVMLLDYKRQIDDDEDSSSSSSSIEIRTRYNATKNEAFRNSVRKVLTCLTAFPKNKGLLPSSDPRNLLACNSSPTNMIPTKMQERSFYTKPHHHSSNFSVASDMQVEVSDSGSPPMAAFEANSPTDQESYDGDVDKDVNSVDDEELWGTSPHPTKLREFGKNFELKNDSEVEEKVYRASNLGSIVQRNASDPPLTFFPREVEEGDVDQQSTIREVVVSSLSPRSILPDEVKKKLEVDLQSTNGTILESRSSAAAASESLTSQMQSKAEHVAEYLANLPPSECGSNLVEEVERSSYVREPSVETVPDEIIPIFESNENIEESKEGSEGSSIESTVTSQIKAPKETSSASNEFQASDLNKEHVDQAPSIIEQNDHLRIIEDEGEPLVANENEVKSSSKEEISDSYSTTCQEDISNRSRVEEYVKTTSQSQVQNEAIDELLSNQIIHDDESTSAEAYHIATIEQTCS